MANKQRYSVKQVSDALMEGNGLVTEASKILGCDWSTVWHYMRRYSTLQGVRKQAKEVLIDKAESKLIELIDRGEPSAIFFFLKCQGKGRGYVERQEFAGVQDAPITIHVMPCLSEDQEKKLTEEAFASVMERRKSLSYDTE